MEGEMFESLWKEFRELFPGVHKVFFKELVKGVRAEKRLSKSDIVIVIEAIVLVFGGDARLAADQVGVKIEPTIRYAADGIQRKNLETGKWEEIKT